MGRYQKDLNRRVKGKAVTVFASAARTSSPANSSSIDTREANSLVLTLAVTAKTGTSPTLDVKLQTSEDNSTWVDVAPAAAFTQVTGSTTLPSTETKIFNHLGAYCRLVATIGGSATPGFTFKLDGYTK